MNKLCSLFATLACLASSATRAENLTGTWKEISRTDPAGKMVDYTDTIRIEFKIGNQYLWMKPNTFQYRGAYTLMDNTLDLGIRSFEVVSRKNAELVLKDDGGTHGFVRYAESERKEDNRAASNGTRARAEVEATGIININQLNGQWEVYKRTNGGEKVAVDYSRIIRKLVVADGKPGEVYSAEDMTGKPSWTIDHLANNILYCKGRDARELTVLKCSSTELILQEGAVTLFFKQFKG